ncbi:type I restriction enzyme S subunit [Salibacterium salarium]|uniref:restriction endonuclease subunit S n=1 Tax=Salibacterium salarium TaxID=284579 RepID=UPI002788D9D4|nr:restriction endonuclease subunit S [Salibacterium salarium]MDQ0298692.1 type I restriction enzyme S subunit [Salibacterium salarium]
MKNKTTPKFRFHGFSEDWIEENIANYANFRRGSFPQPYGNKEWYGGEGAMPFIQVVDVTEHLTLVNDTKQKISVLAQPKSIFVPAGKVVVTLQGSIGRVAITQYDAYVDRTLLIFESYKNRTDERFWAYTIQQKFEIEKRKAPGGTIKTITKEALSSFLVSTPHYMEQQKIGQFFKKLDDQIALQQRQIELLKESKQGFLQKMFPKDGEHVPEVRFDRFSGNWEERKISNYLKESRIKGSNGFDAKKLTVKLWGKGIVEKNSDFKGSVATQYYVRKSGQFMYGKLDFLNQAFGIVPNHLDGYESTLDSPAFDISKDMNSHFLLEYVSRAEFYLHLGTIANGSRKAKRIHVDTFLNMPIHIPNKAEQQKIGQFFKNLDDTIALHEKELELLKKTKQGFLPKMFV